MKEEINKELAEEQEWFNFSKYMKSQDSQQEKGENNDGKNGNESINERKSRKRSKSRGRSISTRSRSLSVSYRSRSLSQTSFSRRSSSIDIYGKKHSKHSKDIYSLANLVFDSKTSKKSVNIIIKKLKFLVIIECIFM